MSLAVARSVKQAHEVGVRKVVGAQRSQIVIQFLGESVLIAFFAMVLGLILADLLLPVIGKWLERPIALNFVQNAWLLPALLVLRLVAVGLLSGSYPSFFLSALRPGKCAQRQNRWHGCLPAAAYSYRGAICGMHYAGYRQHCNIPTAGIHERKAWATTAKTLLYYSFWTAL